MKCDSHKEVDGRKVSLKTLVEGPERAETGEEGAASQQGPEDVVTKTEPTDDTA